MSRALPTPGALSTNTTPPYRMLFDLGHSQMYLLNDTVTAVWHFDDFEPNEGNFSKAVEKAGAMVKKYGVKQVILDFTENGGGDLCVGRFLLDALFDVPSFGPTDVRNNALSRYINKQTIAKKISPKKSSMWYPALFMNAITGTDYTNTSTSWLSPGLKRIRNGTPGNFSQLLALAVNVSTGCTNVPKKPIWSPSHPPPLGPSQYLILTHGICGSTCASVANHAKNYAGVGAIVVGGLDYSQNPRTTPVMQYTSFPGGEVLDSPGFDAALKLIQNGPNDPLLPKPLPTSGEYRFCAREIYGRPPIYRHTLPLEFTWQPADWHMQPYSLGEAFEVEKMWYRAKTFFGQ
eukprot:TRINITY_DN54547_c0_g2_i1.p1 TRINITY_DN54547_c0_g2~~TRINITY_DN54547_c0_g2_i1.p1  ORF type:complete len:347 (+),score=47.43 TRINITY_DN54547_c0_g2_i1:3-1043(+)